jgi:D-alanyl-D-alanine carboxypeptidase (penicillin-binding protein 5/6)
MIRATFSLTALSLLLASAAPAKAPPYETAAPIVYLVDLSSGAVLLSKGADQRIPPASMAKMMTTNVAFELIKKGDLALNKMCTVRPETWKRWHGPQAGSTMFLSPGEQVSVENLLHGIVTLSGNDASVVLAECIAGSEPAFVNVMNDHAKRLGLTNSQFGNSNGWPDEGRTYVTARDLATLARAEVEYQPTLHSENRGRWFEVQDW